MIISILRAQEIALKNGLLSSEQQARMFYDLNELLSPDKKLPMPPL